MKERVGCVKGVNPPDNGFSFAVLQSRAWEAMHRHVSLVERKVRFEECPLEAQAVSVSTLSEIGLGLGL